MMQNVSLMRFVRDGGPGILVGLVALLSLTLAACGPRVGVSPSAPPAGGSGAVATEGGVLPVEKNGLAAPAMVSAAAGVATRSAASIGLPNAEDAPTRLRIVALTKQIKPGDEASLTAETDPGIQCQIGVYYSNGRSKAPELTPKSADATGLVSWRWRVEDDAQVDFDDSSVLVLCSVGRDLLSRGAALLPAD